ncbi:MAG: cytidine deaminase [Candidatus Anstonellaceae archaeon]
MAVQPGIVKTTARILSAERRELLAIALRATDKAHSPKSKFFVGAALLTDDGSVFTGGNIGNAETPVSICAERAAVAKAVAAGKTEFKAMAIIARHEDRGTEEATAPCGLCRQVLSEFPLIYNRPLEVIYSSTNGELVHFGDISALLPEAFSPFSLRKKEQLLAYLSNPKIAQAPLGSKSIIKDLQIGKPGMLVLPEQLEGGEGEVLRQALLAMKSSYAPYGKVWAGAALLGSDGNVYTGALVENALSSASISAIRSAIAAAVSGGQKEFLMAAIVSGKEGAESQNIMPPGGLDLQALSQFLNLREKTPVLLATSAFDTVVKTEFAALLGMPLTLEHYKFA